MTIGFSTDNSDISMSNVTMSQYELACYDSHVLDLLTTTSNSISMHFFHLLYPYQQPAAFISLHFEYFI